MTITFTLIEIKEIKEKKTTATADITSNRKCLNEEIWWVMHPAVISFGKSQQIKRKKNE